MAGARLRQVRPQGEAPGGASFVQAALGGMNVADGPLDGTLGGIYEQSFLQHVQGTTVVPGHEGGLGQGSVGGG